MSSNGDDSSSDDGLQKEGASSTITADTPAPDTPAADTAVAESGGGSESSRSEDVMKKPSGSSSLSSLTPQEQKLYESWFFTAYFAAGFGNATKVLLGPFFADRNVSATLIGIFNSLDDIPVILRVPFGIASDKYDTAYGRRRPYVFFGVLLAALCYIGMGLVEAIEFNFAAFGALFFFIAVGHELWDNALDAYGNEVTPKSQAGRLQGSINAGGRSLGLLIGFAITTVGSTVIGGSTGWAVVFFINAILIFLPAFWVPKVAESTERDIFRFEALREFLRPEVTAHALYVFFGAMPTAILTVVGTLLARDLGLAGFGLAAVLLVGAIVLMITAFAAGRVIDRQRHRMRAMFYGVSFFAVLSLLCYTAAAALESTGLLYGWTLFTGIAAGGILGLNFALMMLEIRDPVISGSFFAIMQTIQRGGGLIGSLISGAMLDNLGHVNTGIIAICIILVQLPIIHFMFRGVDYSYTAEIMTTRIGLDDAARIDCRKSMNSTTSVEMENNPRAVSA